MCITIIFNNHLPWNKLKRILNRACTKLISIPNSKGHMCLSNREVNNDCIIIEEYTALKKYYILST